MKPVIILTSIVISLALLLSTVVLAADKEESKASITPAASSVSSGNKVAIDEAILDKLVDMPAYHIEKARESFIDKNTMNASLEIRLSSMFVRIEAERATSAANRKAFLTTAEKLDNLADNINSGSVSTLWEFDYNILVAGEEIANQHNIKAQEHLANNEIQKASNDLKAAADYTEHSYKWAGKKLEKSTSDAISDGRSITNDIAKGVNITSDRLNKGIKNVGAEISKLKADTEKNKDKK